MATSRLESDRYGVPQYAGASDQFEEYKERAWDLWYGRAGQDALQSATPVHLRAGLSSSAWEAVRKLEHTKLITKDAEGKPTTEGMDLLLETLKSAIADEVPVKINELFLQAFYSPSVWRRPSENMQAYIVRREQDFRKLEESSPGTKVSENLRAMMLLIFGGLDPKEQVSVLSSVNNEYDFGKISHAMRIQFPNAAGKAVQRKDYLGASARGHAPSSSSSLLFRKPRWKSGGKQHAFAAEDYEMEDEETAEDTYYQNDDDEQPGDDADEAWAAASDDELVDAFIAEYPDDPEGDQSLAEAYATVLQHKQFKKKMGGGKGKGGGGGRFNFKGSGEVTFDAKAKENRRQAVQFLKSVTPCTSCGQRGHWNGDDICPNAKKSSKGKSKKKPSTPSSPKKKPATNLFVLHDSLESADEKTQFMCLPNKLPNNDVLKNVKTSEYDLALKNDLCLGNDMPPKYDQVPANDIAPVNDMAHEYDLVPKTIAAHVTNEPNAYADEASKASDATFVNDRTVLFESEGGNNSDGSFTTPFSFS